MEHWLLEGVCLIAAVAVFLASEGIGGLLLRRVPMTDVPVTERVIWRILTGMTGLAVLWTLLGLAGQFNSLVFLLTTAFGLLAAVPRLGAAFRSGVHRQRLPALLQPSSLVLALLCLALTAMVAWGATLPEIFFDALNYHLGLPEQYLVNGRITLVSTAVHSAFPAYADVLLGGVMGLAGPGASKLFTALLWPLGGITTAALYRYLRGRWDAGAAVAALTAAGAPGVLVMATMCSIDGALLAAGGLAMLGAARTGTSDRPRKWAVLAGIAAGFAVGSKYTGLYLLVACAVLVLALRPSRAALWDAAVLVAVAATIASPWYVRNLALLGNPIYPVLEPWLNPDGPGALSLARLRRDIPDLGWVPLRWWKTGVALLSQPHRLGAGAQVGWLLPAAAVGLLVGICRPSPWRPWGLCALAFLLLWSLQAPAGRYLYPLFPLLAATGSCALQSWLTSRRRAIGAAALAVVAVCTCLHGAEAWLIMRSLYGPAAWQVHSGSMSRDAYLREHLAYYGAAQCLHANAASAAQVLLVGETRLLYLERPLRFSSAYDRSEFGDWIAAHREPTALNERLRQMGIAYVLINRREIRRLQRAYDHMALGEEQMDRIAVWLRTCRLVYNGRGVQLCAVES